MSLENINMTREYKIKLFLVKEPKRWCEADRCYCIGCVNKLGPRIRWKEQHPDEPPITKEEFDKYKTV